MADTKDTSGVIGPALDGVGYVFSAPARLPLVRTALKEAIKLGLRTSQTIQGVAAAQGQHWRDLVTEAQAETAQATTSSAKSTARAARSQSGATAAPRAAQQNMADQGEDELQSLNGVGPDTAELLTAAGIRSLRSLARRNPENLHDRLVEINDERGLAGSVPSAERIQEWIDSI